jgi:hypothetical protein
VSYSVSLEDPATRKFGTADVNCANFFSNAGIVLDNGMAVNGNPCTNRLNYTIPPVGSSAYTLGIANAPSAFGFRVPDIITNLRVDQAWGYVGFSTAIHDASGGYYNVNGAGAPLPVPPGGIVAPQPANGIAWSDNNVNNGHPADKYGWAVSAFGLLNLQGGDIIGVNVSVARGAPGYTTNTNFLGAYNNSNRRALGFVVDGVFGQGTDVELTESWSIVAGYQHVWGAAGTWAGKWRTSLYGGYTSINYNDRATALINSQFGSVGGASVCGGPGNNIAGTIQQFSPKAGNNCSPDVSWFEIGSRTQFNPAPLMDIGLDLWYTKVNTAYKGPVSWIANGSRPTCNNAQMQADGGCAFEDWGTLTALVRWQRNFYP